MNDKEIDAIFIEEAQKRGVSRPGRLVGLKKLKTLKKQIDKDILEKQSDISKLREEVRKCLGELGPEYTEAISASTNNGNAVPVWSSTPVTAKDGGEPLTVSGFRLSAESKWRKWAETHSGKPGAMLEKDSELTTSRRWLLRWHAFGCPTFELTGGLAAALIMTECRGLLWRDVRLPFTALAVQMPSPSPLVIDGADVRIMTIGRFERRDASPVIACQMVVGARGDYAMVLEMPELNPVEEDIRVCDQSHAARLIVNLCAYINSLHALPPSEGKRKVAARGEKKRDEPVPPQRWVLGREIKLCNGMTQAARSLASADATSSERHAYRLHARFMVRGHWRQQACGQKHSNRKLRWIEPYWKGPQMADGLARLYSVSEAERAGGAK